jgi:hypothetical protein
MKNKCIFLILWLFILSCKTNEPEIRSLSDRLIGNYGKNGSWEVRKKGEISLVGVGTSSYLDLKKEVDGTFTISGKVDIAPGSVYYEEYKDYSSVKFTNIVLKEVDEYNVNILKDSRKIGFMFIWPELNANGERRRVAVLSYYDKDGNEFYIRGE